MTSASALHVRCDHLGIWCVRREGDEHPLSQHGNETEAERAAAWHAAQTGAPAIFLHDRYHRVRPIWTARERGDRDRRRAGEVITA